MGIRHFIFRTISYGLLILMLLEGLVRVFHLHKDNPERMIDKYGVEKWVPNQTGISVTGNRRQNIGTYNINASGFNSYREFQPTENEYEIALLGDSFIEGFHQDYDHSIGKKIEQQLTGVQVYEYGYAGYDLADQLHLIKAYDSVFRKIDKIIIYLKYPDDLRREEYQVSYERIRLEQGGYKILKKSKLLIYCQNIGLLTSMTRPLSKLYSPILNSNPSPLKATTSKTSEEDYYLSNFKKLWADQEIKNQKIVLLLDARSFPEQFLRFLKKKKIAYLDYGETLLQTSKPVTLIYDQHWNDHGRGLIAQLIANELKPYLYQ